MNDRLTVTISGPAGIGKTRFGDYLIRALVKMPDDLLSVYPRSGGATIIDRATEKFHLAEETGEPVYLGRFERRTDVWLSTSQDDKTCALAAKGDPVEPPFGYVGDRTMDSAMVDAGMMSHADYVSKWGDPGYGKILEGMAQKAIKPEDVQEGDRIRLVMECTAGELPMTLERITGLSERFGATIELIDRPEKPLAVGDRVRLMNGQGEGVILAFTSDGRAVVEYEAGDTTNVMSRDVSCLTRI